MLQKVFSLIGLISLSALPAQQDPVRIWATLSPNPVEAGSMTTLEVHLETSGGRPGLITLPDLPPGLEILNINDHTQLQFSLPGGRTRLHRREIRLRAGDPGDYRIPPISAEVRGAHYETEELTLRVTDRIGPRRTSRPAPPDSSQALLPLTLTDGNVARGPQDEVLLRVRLIPDTIYQGQQVTLFAQAWVSEDAQLRLRRAPEYYPPELQGAWTHDLPRRGRAGRRIIEERPYRVQEFQRAYFPLISGEFIVPPARLLYEVRRSFLYATDDQELTTDSLRLVVLPLPEEGRPPNYNGAVGQFTIRASLEPGHIPAGESAALVLEVDGIGNTRALPPPSLSDLDGVEVHQPTEDATTRESNGVISGVKRFTWILVPRNSGLIEIPPIEYPYFDPELGRYLVARTDPLFLEVGAGQAVQGTADPEGAELATLRGIRVEPTPVPGRLRTRSTLFALIIGIPLIALAPIIIMRRRGRETRGERRERRSPERRRECDELLDQLSDDRERSDSEFYHELERILRFEISSIIDRDEMPRASIRTLQSELEGAGIPQPTVNESVRLLTEIEAARFRPRPGSIEKRERHIEETRRLLTILEEQINAQRVDRGRDRGVRRRKGTRSGTTVGLLILLALPLPNEVFRDAVAHYRERDFAAAAAGFSEYLHEYPDDPNGWYNLGNAEFHDGRRGEAIRAWLRTLRLTPRDADARYNLRIAGADPELIRSATGRIPLSSDELLLLAALLAALGVTSLIAHALTGRRGLNRIGTLGCAVAFITLAMSLNPLRTNPHAIALSPELRVHIAPDRRSEVLQVLDGGEPLRVSERRGEWLLVTTHETEGWAEEHLIGEF